jgi:trans-aconitate methyltransferase
LPLFKDIEFTWDNSKEHEFDWRKNNAVIKYLALWIDDKDTSVADLGCGKEMHLRECLPCCCKYIPVDYLSRSEDTIVCDFNEKDLPELKVDVAFVSGVLQVIKDPVQFLNWVCSIAKKVIIRTTLIDHLSAKEIFMGNISCVKIELVENTITGNNFQCTRKEVASEVEGRKYAYLCFEKKQA